MGMFDNTTTSTFNIKILEQLLYNGLLYGNIYDNDNEPYEDHDPNIIDVEYKEIKEENDV